MNTDLSQELSAVLRSWQTDACSTCLNVYSAFTGEGGLSKWEATCITVSVVLSEFQRVCVRMHQWLVEKCLQPLVIANGSFGATLIESLTKKSALGSGNPTLNRLSSDFGTLGLNLWQSLEAIAPREIPELKRRLMELIEIRNRTVHGRDISGEMWEGEVLEMVFTPLDSLVRLI